ncbi:MAG: excalibur calcium-binding domain-containing protein [Acidimicrobiales bacterium]
MNAQKRLARLAFLTVLAAGGCGTSTTPAPPTAPPGADVPQEDAAQLLRTLTVATDVDPGGYDRERFDYPQGGTDAARCSTRARVLIRDSIEPAQVAYPGCEVLAGRWIDPYTGVTYTSPADVSIDHIVPLKESWRSGAAAWPIERLVGFGNDVAHRDALAVVEGSGNEQKGDKDPARWRPPDRARWGTYAAGWVKVKAAWGLTVDPAEKAALEAMLINSPAPSATQTSRPVPSPPTTELTPSTGTPVAPSSPPSVYYPGCAAARAAGAAPLQRGQPGYRDGLDADRNGVACSERKDRGDVTGTALEEHRNEKSR